MPSLKLGAEVTWDIWEDYYYRYDTHQRCCNIARELVETGLLEKPVMGQGRNCRISATRRSLLEPVAA